MPVEAAPLLELMSSQVARQREEILAQARCEAVALREAARKHAAADLAAALAAVRAEIGNLDARAREHAETEARKLILNTKDVIADEVLRTVMDDLRGMADGPEFAPVLHALLAELFRDAPEDAVVLAPPRHVDAVRDWLAAHGRAAVEVIPLATLRDGVAVQDRARTRRTTNSLSARLARRENAARRLCMERLFEPEK
ncbi:MAG TPA: V-type ATP synthase subunit E [Candidatus Hydrogenedentes bacterium]|nr:V-type ATP synthase subunit E [Candidatus Hydrogenedentota bacterium]